MPDFDLVPTWTCASNFYFERVVTGSKGDVYTVHWGRLMEARAFETGAQYGWQCTCRGYKYRGTCRHIDEVKASGERCGWNGTLEPTAQCDHDANGEPCCPDCGGPVRVMRVAV